MLFMELPLVVRLALLGALVVGTVVVANRGFQYGILLVLITGIFGMQGMLIWGGSLPNLTMDRIVWPLLLVVFLLKWRRGELNKQPPDLVEYAMLMLLSVILMSMYVHQTYVTERIDGEKVQMGEFLTGFVMPFTLYAIVRRGIFTASQVYAFFVGIGVFSLYLAITSVSWAAGMEWLVYPQYILDPSLGIHVAKSRGIFLNATHNGLAMAMGLPILFWLWMKSSGIMRWLWLGTFILAGVAIIPTFQRAPWLGAAAALGVMATTSQRRFAVSIGVCMLIVALGLLAAPGTYLSRLEDKVSEQQTVDFRIELIDASIGMIRAHPLTGIGFNRFQDEVPNYNNNFIGEVPSHNLPLTIFAELGLLGFAPFILIFTALFTKSLLYYWHLPQYRTVIVLIWAVTVAYSVSLVSVHLDVAYPNVLLFALWGMILATLRRHIVPRAMYQKPRQAIISFV